VIKVLKRLENIYVVFIILCSTSFFSLAMLGPIAKVGEILGIGIIAVLLLLYIVYAKQDTFKHQYSLFIVLIFLSLITSMLMAKFSRNQDFSATLFAQRAIYYYLFYFLLHQLKVRPEDLERIFIYFGLLHVLLYLIQFFLFPRIIFDVFILADRGTVRIYMKGSDYLVISYFMSLQAFFRTNNFKYLFLTLLFFSIFVLLGGRQTMAIMAFVLILFLLFNRKIKSRFFIGILILACIGLVFIMFQGVFEALLVQSVKDRNLGSNYIRFLSARHFLTDFFQAPMAYLTGNGMYGNNTSYGLEIKGLMAQGFYLGDIGLLGNYVIYGALFIIGVLGICIKSVTAKYLQNQAYIRYVFIAICFSLITGGGFVNADFICAISCLMYMIDVSNFFAKTE
jgi:hypothetical protein